MRTKWQFLPEYYQQLQVLRFAVEEINNSTSLLPNVSLGYDLFDYCSDSLNLQVAYDFLSSSLDRSVPVLDRNGHAPIQRFHSPPQISPGASSIRLSHEPFFNSFLRTIPSDLYQVRAIVQLLQRFKWNWVAFIGSDNDYSQDALQVFNEETQRAGICVPYQNTIPQDPTGMLSIFRKIEALKVSVVVVFATQDLAVPFIQAAVANDIRDKVWIASEAWSTNQFLFKLPGIEAIGTVLGISISGLGPLPGFKEFVYRTIMQSDHEACAQTQRPVTEEMCNQDCPECSSLTPEALLEADPTYSFNVYSAVYAVAHSLHQLLGCGANTCTRSGPVLPHMVLEGLKKVDFMLKDRVINFDQNGDPTPYYDIVVWDRTSLEFPKRVGLYTSDPAPRFTLNESLIPWYTNGRVPILICTAECEEGHRKLRTGVHDCCFQCEVCPNGTYIDKKADPYNCTKCEDDEWSGQGSTSCKKRTLQYLHYTDHFSIALVVSTVIALALSIAITILFARNRDTPVVKSAGGTMCFFMLSCLSVACMGIFSYIGEPVLVKCTLRNPVFAVFYTACLSCLAVRSFQIVFIFKMAAQLPKAYDFWVKHNGQWLVIVASVVIQIFLCGIWIGTEGPQPFSDAAVYIDQIIVSCTMGGLRASLPVTLFVSCLSVACFIFSYMGTDLPKNYNEARSVTLSLLIFFLSWISFFTAYIVYSGKYIQAFNAVSVLVSLYGILAGYFFPKCYIILFKPEQNTTAHFQTCIQSYTKSISSK
ncbi:taste receptor type 1 member 1-like [Amia ocellicauda]|uniref:taste receptor type 1 member 1-like n=1 Tax=Amia ocellicauda TaxID=2972642 RepID=UPI0034646483